MARDTLREMNTDVLAAAFATMRAVLANVPPDQYDQPTPCASWDVRALINHVVGGSQRFGEAVRTGVRPATDHLDFSDNPLATFDAGVAAALDAFGDPDAADKTVKMPAGEIPVAVYLNMAATDMFVHAWDLAKATGQDTNLDPELATQLMDAARQLLDGKPRGGPNDQFDAAVEVPETAHPAEKLVAFLGRQP